MNSFLGRILRDQWESLPTGYNLACLIVPVSVVWPVWTYLRPNEDQLGAIISAVSIYSALLFGILIPAGDQARRLKEQAKDLGETTVIEAMTRSTVLSHHRTARNILANVSFSIMVSLCLVLVLIVSLCIMPKTGAEPSFWYRAGLSVSAYFFVYLLALLLIVVRTVYGSTMHESSL